MRYLAKNIPVVVRGVVDSWPAVQRWRKADFLRHYGALITCGHWHFPIRAVHFRSEDCGCNCVQVI